MIWIGGGLAFLLLLGTLSLESRKRSYSQTDATAWTVGLFILAVLILIYALPHLPQ